MMTGWMLTWFAAGLCALFIFWGIDVSVNRRPRAVFWIVAIIALFSIYTQSILFGAAKAAASNGMLPSEAAATQDTELFRFLNTFALHPGNFRDSPASHIYKIITSSLMHYGWLSLILNLWFIVLFGYVLEFIIGRVRFLIIATTGLVLPTLADALLPSMGTTGFTGGASGMVYAILGASMVRMPRARSLLAINLDLAFWLVTFLIVFPLSLFTRYGGPALTETLLIGGLFVAFYVLQPTCQNRRVPLWVPVAFKLFVDVVLLWHVTEPVLQNSVWRIGTGFLTGAVLCVTLCGISGLTQRWRDEPRRKPLLSRRKPVSQLQKEAESDSAAATQFLMQRVFVGDINRVLEFYPRVVRQKFPDLVLPLIEQLALARALQFKGRDDDALHVYENLLKAYKLDNDRWEIWLKAAELLLKVDPARSADARRYLETFLSCDTILMRDRIEAEHLLRGLVPANIDHAEELDKDVGQAVPSSVEESPLRPLSVKPATENLRKHKTKAEPDAIPMEWMTPLAPQTFDVIDGSPTTPARRNAARFDASSSGGNFTPAQWKILPLESKNRLDEEKILQIQARGAKAPSPEHSTGVYGAPQDSAKRRTGRIANIQAIKSEFQPKYAPGPNLQTSGSTDHLQRGAASNYSTARDLPRPNIRLARERKREES